MLVILTMFDNVDNADAETCCVESVRFHLRRRESFFLFAVSNSETISEDCSCAASAEQTERDRHEHRAKEPERQRGRVSGAGGAGVTETQNETDRRTDRQTDRQRGDPRKESRTDFEQVLHPVQLCEDWSRVVQ